MLLNFNMVIISKYSLEFKSESGFFKVKSKESIPCPLCDNDLEVYGSRKRVLLKQDGSKQVLIIRRLQCKHCKVIHHELPDIIVPYKRFESGAIESVLVDEGFESTAFPGEERTYRRLKLWFFLLHAYYEGCLKALKERSSIVSEVVLPLYPLKRQTDGWLKHLVRHLTNFGLWLQTRSVSIP